VLIVLSSCSSSNDTYEELPDEESPTPPEEMVLELNHIPANAQRPGDTTIGKEYLLSGDYMSSPLQLLMVLAWWHLIVCLVMHQLLMMSL